MVRPRDDQVRLAINGQDLGARPLLATRGLYSWHVETAQARRGMNVLTLTTSRTMRPADRTPGGDPRLLGLLLRRWTLARPIPPPGRLTSPGSNFLPGVRKFVLHGFRTDR